MVSSLGPGFSGFKGTVVPGLCWDLYKAGISGLPLHRFKFVSTSTSQCLRSVPST